jgi:tetratricopeptide (TPR) repeat protein
MAPKTIAIIICFLSIIAFSSSNAEDIGSPFPRTQPTPYGVTRAPEISPKLEESIFVPLSEVDPTAEERSLFVKAGREAMEAGNIRKAETLFRLALRLDINDLKANLALGNMLFDAKQYQQAGRYFLRVLQQDPNHTEALLNMGKINFSLFKKTEAFEFFQEVAELNPGHPEAIKYINYILGEDRVEDGLPEEYYAIPYSPSLTRAELAALVYFRTDELKAIKTPPKPQIITDIGESWSEKYIQGVAKYEVMDVYPNHTFRPQAAVNKGEFAQVIMNLMQGLGLYDIYKEKTPRGRLSFDDVDPFNNYYQAVRLVTDLEIMVPGKDRNFNMSRIVSGERAVEYFDRFDRAVRLLRANK